MNQTYLSDDLIFVDFEYNEIGEILTFQYKYKDKIEILAFPDATKKRIKEILKGKHVIGWHIIGDFQVLNFTDSDLEEFKDYDDLYYAYIIYDYKSFCGDEQMDLYSVLKRENIVDLSNINKKELQKLFMDMKPYQIKGYLKNKKIVEYIENDVRYLDKLYTKLLNTIKTSKVYKLDKEMFKPVLYAHSRGLPFDIVNAEKRKEELTQLAEAIEKEVRNEYGIYVDSPPQVSSILEKDEKCVEIYNYIVKNGIVTVDNKKQKFSTKSEVLEFLDHPLAKKVLEFRDIRSSLSYLTEHIKNVTKNNGRLKGKFYITQAPSGRMSCQDVNLQQVKRELRRFITSDEGSYILKIDYATIELRLVAIIAKDKVMIDLFQKMEDLHTKTTQKIFNKDQVTKEERKIGKACNFSLLYGMAARKLVKTIHEATGIFISLDQAEEFKTSWFDLYKDIKQWHKAVGQRLKFDGYIDHNQVGFGKTIMGRRYRTTYINSSLNYPIQGTGADLFKVVAVRAYKDGVRFINFVHDEYVAEVSNEKEGKEIIEVINNHAQDVWNKFCEVVNSPKIPLLMEASLLKSWLEEG